MPVITQAGEDGVVTAWLVDEGARVSVGTLIAEVQAEKVAEDIAAPADGIVSGLVPINQPVPQGQPICRILESADAPIAPAAVAAAPRAGAPAGTRVVASPAAKRLAQELGVDLSRVTGTGPQGRVSEADVAAAAEPGDGAAAMTGLRAVIARNMRESAARTAAVTLTTRAEVVGPVPGEITAWVISCAAKALKDHPYLNGTADGDRFVAGEDVHVAVAVQTDEGLVAPVVRNAAELTVHEIADTLRQLAERARSRSLSASDFADATFSVSNLGGYGIDAFTPIVNPPQVAILGVGALRRLPVFDDAGDVVARASMTLSLTFDHAFVDGAPAAAFLAQLRKLLEAGSTAG